LRLGPPKFFGSLIEFALLVGERLFQQVDAPLKLVDVSRGPQTGLGPDLLAE
jgi:hypothetical protein